MLRGIPILTSRGPCSGAFFHKDRPIRTDDPQEVFSWESGAGILPAGGEALPRCSAKEGRCGPSWKMDFRLGCMKVVLKYGKGQMYAQIRQKTWSGSSRPENCHIVPDRLEAVKKARWRNQSAVLPRGGIIQQKKRTKSLKVVVIKTRHATEAHCQIVAASFPWRRSLQRS